MYKADKASFYLNELGKEDDATIYVGLSQYKKLHYTSASLGVIPWHICMGQGPQFTVFDFGGQFVTSGPTATVLGYKFRSELDTERNVSAGKHQPKYIGVCEWTQGEERILMKWGMNALFVDTYKIHSWIEHHSFEELCHGTDDADKTKIASLCTDYYWAVRKDPEIIEDLIRKCHKSDPTALTKDQMKKVLEVYFSYKDQATFGGFGFSGCPTEDFNEHFVLFQIFGTRKFVNRVFEVPGIGKCRVSPIEMMNVPPFTPDQKICPRPVIEGIEHLFPTPTLNSLGINPY